MQFSSFFNPVFDEYLADPYCFLHDGHFYALGTGKIEADPNPTPARVVPMVRSENLQDWESLGRVLIPPAEEHGGCFWAPEVAFHNNKFYLYYHPSGTGRGFHIRVAVADRPEGPYLDTGQPLTDLAKNPFAIDAHPFRDHDGQWYLFYATDFHDSNPTTFRGTALVVDRLLDMTRLAGDPRIVMRAHHAWQLYQPQRLMNGITADWYTLEGPTVRFKNGKYYCFYSGGCYLNATYGVDYIVADHPLGPWREVGDTTGPKLMRSMPGEVIGPGHHSIVTVEGQDFAVYHAWNKQMTDRLMCVDPLLWTERGPVIERFVRG